MVLGVWRGSVCVCCVMFIANFGVLGRKTNLPLSLSLFLASHLRFFCLKRDAGGCVCV